MANLIQLKRASAWNVSEDPGATALAEGELAWNNQGKKLWMGRKIASTGTTHELFRVNKEIYGVANETNVTEAANSFTIGLPDSITIGDALTVTGAASIGASLTVTGNLTVNGTTTTVNSTELSVDDKNITLGHVATPTDTTADGGGITLLGANNKTILYESTGDKWMINKPLDVAGALTSTGVVTASGGNSSNWNTAYTDRNKWDGGSTGLTAATGRTSLGLGTAAVLNTAAVADGASTVATGDQIYDFVTGSYAGDITSVGAGSGLSGGGTSGSVTLAVDLSELADDTADPDGTDDMVFVTSAGATKKYSMADVPLTAFDETGFIQNTSTIDGGTF